MLKTLKLSVFFGLLVLFFAFTKVNVLAIYDEAVNTTSSEEYKETKSVERMELKNKVNEKVETKAAMKVEKLSEARLKICQSREERISNRFTNLLSLGAGSHQNFEGFVVRVDDFYQNTLVVQGYSLENYKVLKADIAKNQVAVKTALEQVRLSGRDFSCDSEDPKAQTDTFRQNMQVLINANKAYKTSVRTFVAAVRDLAKEAKSATLSPSPEVSSEVEAAPVVSEAPVE